MQADRLAPLRWKSRIQVGDRLTGIDRTGPNLRRRLERLSNDGNRLPIGRDRNPVPCFAHDGFAALGQSGNLDLFGVRIDQTNAATAVDFCSVKTIRPMMATIAATPRRP